MLWFDLNVRCMLGEGIGDKKEFRGLFRKPSVPSQPVQCLSGRQWRAFGHLRIRESHDLASTLGMKMDGRFLGDIPR